MLENVSSLTSFISTTKRKTEKMNFSDHNQGAFGCGAEQKCWERQHIAAAVNVVSATEWYQELTKRDQT